MARKTAKGPFPTGAVLSRVSLSGAVVLSSTRERTVTRRVRDTSLQLAPECESSPMAFSATRARNLPMSFTASAALLWSFGRYCRPKCWIVSPETRSAGALLLASALIAIGIGIIRGPKAGKDVVKGREPGRSGLGT